MRCSAWSRWHLLGFGPRSARCEYFYRNTELDGATFDYHGRPLAILKGRAIVLVLMLAFNMAGQFSDVAAAAAGPGHGLVFPPLLVRSLRFRTPIRATAACASPSPAAMPAATGLPAVAARHGGHARHAGAAGHQRFKQYQHEHTRYGTVPFAFSAHAGAFYGVYLRTFAMMLGRS